MRSSSIAPLVAWALLVAPAARAGDDAETEAIRRDFDALVRRIEDGPQPDTDSPTALVNRLASAHETKLRAVLDGAWRIAGPLGRSGDDRFFSVRWAIRLLFGPLPVEPWNLPRPEPPVEASGVLRILDGDGHGSFCGNCNEQHGTPPTLDELIGAGSMRRHPATSVDAMRALDEFAEAARAALAPVRVWVQPEDDDLARATGEACAGDREARTRLLQLAAAPDRPALVVTAVAWMRAPETVPFLRALLRSTAKRVADGEADAKGLLAVTCRGLAHVDRAALATSIADLPARSQDAVLGEAGLDVAEPFVAKWIEAARDSKQRVAALERTGATLRGRYGPSTLRYTPLSDLATPPAPSGAAIERLLVRLAAQLRFGDEPTRRAALDVAALVLGDAKPSGLRPWVSMRSRDVSISSEAETIEPYPTTEAALRTVVADVGSRAMSLSDGWVSAVDAEAQFAGDSCSPATSDVPWPDDGIERMTSDIFDTDLRPSVHLAAAKSADGLRVTITNRSPGAICLDPVSLRHVEARRVVYLVRRNKQPDTEFRELELELGGPGVEGFVPASSLVAIPAGKSFEFTIPLLPEDRDAAHIAVSLSSRIAVRGTPAGELISRFSPVLVR